MKTFKKYITEWEDEPTLPHNTSDAEEFWMSNLSTRKADYGGKLNAVAKAKSDDRRQVVTWTFPDGSQIEKGSLGNFGLVEAVEPLKLGTKMKVIPFNSEPELKVGDKVKFRDEAPVGTITKVNMDKEAAEVDFGKINGGLHVYDFEFLTKI